MVVLHRPCHSHIIRKQTNKGEVETNTEKPAQFRGGVERKPIIIAFFNEFHN